MKAPENSRPQLPDLGRRPFERRALKSILLSSITVVCAVLACVPLFSVLVMLIYRGGSRLTWELFSSLPPTVMQPTGGGISNAIIGTLFMAGIASLITVPFGVLTAVYLAEAGPGSKIATTARFAAKTMSGLPSIIAGVVVYIIVVRTTGYSAWAGGIALSLLMLPTILLTSEEAIKMVPQRMKEAAVGIGCTPAQAMLKVVLPTALPGITTGIILAMARGAGETAPLLFTALFSEYGLEMNDPTASLAVLIYNYSSSFSENQVELAWAAALVLVLLVFLLNMVSRWFGSRTGR